MAFKLDRPAQDFIRKKGCVCAIRQVSAGGGCMEVPQTEISFETPGKLNGYEAFSEGDVAVYLSRSLRFKGGAAEISLGRLLFLRWIEVQNLVGLSGCDLETAY
jgi:hypothetical protein